MVHVSLLSGYTFFLGLTFDGYDDYEDIRDYKLEVITDLPDLDPWDGVMSHNGGDIIEIQVR